MTTQRPAPPAWLVCRECGHVHQQDWRYCGECGAQRPWSAGAASETDGAVPPPRSGHGGGREQDPPGPRGSRTSRGGAGAPDEDSPGEATRYLAAVAHMSTDFAQGCVAEYLTEPLRCIPYSPGVDAAAVLGDAAAAHARRRLRDGLLLLCALLMAVTAPAIFVFWLVTAAVIGHFGWIDRRGARSVGRNITLLAVVVVGILQGVSGAYTTTAFYGLLAQYGVLLPDLGAGYTLLGILGVVAVLGIPVLIGGDDRPRREAHSGAVRPEPLHPWPRRRPGLVGGLRLRGRDRFEERLADTTRAATVRGRQADADVVVFRGANPFVGTGTRWDDRVLVLPLKRADGHSGPTPTVDERALHGAIEHAFRDLNRPSTLAPEERLGRLRHRHQLLVDADHLVSHHDRSPLARRLLPEPHGAAPEPTIPVTEAQQHIDAPREWARYYQLFQVEAWEQDLSVSCFVSLGTDSHMLVLEWDLRVLPPLDPGWRMIDDRRALTRWGLGDAANALFFFPTSLAARARLAFGRFRTIDADRDELVAERYGAAASLRELAGTPAEDHFHIVDMRRYTRLFDQTVLDTVRQYLESRGLSVADLDEARKSIFSFGNITNSTVAVGEGATSTTGGYQPGQQRKDRHLMSDRYHFGDISDSTVAVGRGASAWSGAPQVSFAQLRDALDVLDGKLAGVEQTPQIVMDLRVHGMDLQRTTRDDSTADMPTRRNRWKTFAAAAAALVSATSIGVAADLAQITELAGPGADVTERFCTGCGADRQPEDRFCTSCGSRWPGNHGSDLATRDARGRPAGAVPQRSLGQGSCRGRDRRARGRRSLRRPECGGRPAAAPPPPAPTTTTPPPPDPARELSVIEAQDQATVDGLEGSWVPQVSSKRVGLRVDDRVYDAQAILDDHRVYRARYPGAVLFGSERFGTYSRPGFYVTVVAHPYPTPTGALRWCAAAGLDLDNCYAVRLIDVPDGLPTVATH